MEIGREESKIPYRKYHTGFSYGELLCPCFINETSEDLVLIIFRIAVIVGSFSFVSGIFLLCVVLKDTNNELAETVLMSCIGVFITSMAFVSWKLKTRRYITNFVNEEQV